VSAWMVDGPGAKDAEDGFAAMSFIEENTIAG
jgi:hypothetical protein